MIFLLLHLTLSNQVKILKLMKIKNNLREKRDFFRKTRDSPLKILAYGQPNFTAHEIFEEFVILKCKTRVLHIVFHKNAYMLDMYYIN